MSEGFPHFTLYSTHASPLWVNYAGLPSAILKVYIQRAGRPVGKPSMKGDHDETR